MASAFTTFHGSASVPRSVGGELGHGASATVPSPLSEPHSEGPFCAHAGSTNVRHMTSVAESVKYLIPRFLHCWCARSAGTCPLEPYACVPCGCGFST